ncbi:hypothetical protein MK805_05055 [Shimazuella sp. AN120528]|uniref:hypothetical protein n=1 Tax=Shimazuella soli TaxID=1892854 RepID=UPI001F0E560F|nr:hypothetical protein [Shimazuella soli]MCH5584337.1 hypothetical protein [Shimazuella soli]
MQFFTLTKIIGGIGLIVFAVPRLEWDTQLQILFSSLWVMFTLFYVIANWNAWKQTAKKLQRQKEYQWRQNWLQHKKKQRGLGKSY